jgi:hypothetical protein
VLNSTRWGALTQEIKGAASLQQQREQLVQQKALQEKQFQSIDALRKSQILENDAQAKGGRFAPSNKEKLIAARDRAQAEGNLEDAASYQAEIDRTRVQEEQADVRIKQAAGRLGISAADLSLKLREAGVTLQPVAVEDAAPTEDRTPAITVPPLPALTPTARPLTTANVGKQQEILSASSVALREINAVAPLISSETVGPMAAAKSLLIDRGLANIWPDLANKDRIEASSVFARIRASTFRALRSDSNINKDEVEQISKQIPSVEDFLNSPVNSMVKIESIAHGIQERAIQAVRQLNQIVPDDILRSLDDKQMSRHHREKRLTDEEARRWFQLNPTP